MNKLFVFVNIAFACAHGALAIGASQAWVSNYVATCSKAEIAARTVDLSTTNEMIKVVSMPDGTVYSNICEYASVPALVVTWENPVYGPGVFPEAPGGVFTNNMVYCWRESDHSYVHGDWKIVASRTGLSCVIVLGTSVYPVVDAVSRKFDDGVYLVSASNQDLKICRLASTFVQPSFAKTIFPEVNQ